MARNYSSTAGVKTLASDISSSSATQLTLTEATDDLPSPPFMLVINPDTDKEEIVLVNADQTGVSEPTYKITRGQDDTTPDTHTAGHIVKHMIVGSDLQLPHNHIDASSIVHGILSGEGNVVGTAKAQTLTNKTLTLPKINENVALTATSTELNYVDGVTSAIQTQFTNQTSALTAHEADTTAIHGIVDTSKLATIVSASVGRKLSVQALAPGSPAVGDIWFQVTGL
jgi:hypothetical protein